MVPTWPSTQLLSASAHGHSELWRHLQQAVPLLAQPVDHLLLEVGGEDALPALADSPLGALLARAATTVEWVRDARDACWTRGIMGHLEVFPNLPEPGDFERLITFFF